jgi:uncharacterized protein
MDTNAEHIEVKHNAAARRFEADLGDGLALAEYRKDGNTYIFTHTEVPPHHEGQGIAGRVVRVALDTVRAEGATLVPSCPYVKSYIKRHPEYAPLVRQEG